jgi:serine/threonine protein kinase
MSCKVIFTYPDKQSFCIVDSAIEKYEQSGRVYIIHSDIVIDEVSYSIFKNPSFKSFVAVETKDKVSIEKKEFKVYSLKPMKITEESLEEVKMEEKIKSPKMIGQGSFGSVVYYPTQNVVVKTSVDKSEDIPIDTIREISIYNLLYKISCLPELYDFELGEKTKMIFERGISTVKEAYVSFTENQAKICMFRLLNCMRNIASQGIIHCDLKPQNMILSEDGHAQIIDWGLSEIDTSIHQDRVKYSDKQTMWYRAPEICLGAKEYSNKIDVFSLGMIFLEIHKKKYLYGTETLSDYIIVLLRKLYGFSKEKTDTQNKIGIELKNCILGDEKTLDHKTIQTTLEASYEVKDSVFSDLIARMLYPNPDERYTYDQAMNHPYFKSLKDSSRTLPDLPKFLNNMPLIPDLEKIWFVKKDKEILLNFNMRNKLFGWLKDMVKYVKFSYSTMFLSFQLVDRYIFEQANGAGVSITKKSLQLLGLVCLIISSKIFEYKLLSSQDGATITPYTKGVISKFEKDAVYNVFKGNLYMPTFWSYAEQYGKGGTVEDIYMLYFKKSVYDRKDN